MNFYKRTPTQTLLVRHPVTEQMVNSEHYPMQESNVLLIEQQSAIHITLTRTRRNLIIFHALTLQAECELAADRGLTVLMLAAARVLEGLGGMGL